LEKYEKILVANICNIRFCFSKKNRESLLHLEKANTTLKIMGKYKLAETPR
jgi:hypothetical protein